ncbi:hypothetical protein C8F01DRAFT_1262411 [Mycena amicta]|nr:hypothetical protein C8F01DRAFT_1262411 [Mycena amicta]
MSAKARRTPGVRSGRFADDYKRVGSPTRAQATRTSALSSLPSHRRPRRGLPSRMEMIPCKLEAASSSGGLFIIISSAVGSSGKSHGWEMTRTQTQEGRRFRMLDARPSASTAIPLSPFDVHLRYAQRHSTPPLSVASTLRALRNSSAAAIFCPASKEPIPSVVAVYDPNTASLDLRRCNWGLYPALS